MSGDPRQCRLNAAECFRAAESAASAKSREQFRELAKIWLKLAAQFESDEALLKSWGDVRAKPSWAANDMSRRRTLAFSARSALPASDLEVKIMALLSDARVRRTIKGVTIVYLGDMGRRPNWYARPSPPFIPRNCMKHFVTAFAQVRKDYDLLS